MCECEWKSKYEEMKIDNFHLSVKCLTLKKQVEELDKQINKIMKSEKKAVKETKNLLKIDHKQDKKLAACAKSKKSAKTKQT